MTCSETCSTTAEMRSTGAADCTPKTELSAIYDPGLFRNQQVAGSIPAGGSINH
jgi:hypothetical protein